MSTPLPASLRCARVCLLVFAALALLMAVATPMVFGVSAPVLGLATYVALPGAVALACALRLHRGGRPLFWTIVALQVVVLLQAVANLGTGDPRALTQLVLPVVVLVLLTRPAARARLLR